MAQKTIGNVRYIFPSIPMCLIRDEYDFLHKIEYITYKAQILDKKINLC